MSHNLRIFYIFILILIYLNISSVSQEKAGQLFVESISKNSSWENNLTGANINSIFYIQVGDLPKNKITTFDSAIIANLSLTKEYLVKIFLESKRIASFRLSFNNQKKRYLKLWYKTNTGAWIISPSTKIDGKPVNKNSIPNDHKSIHVLVALCDNKSQGIVPVSDVLGNGNDPKNNLYWGAMYGIKTYFKKDKTWDLILTIDKPNEFILERCVFQNKKFSSIMVADAYRGSAIKQTTKDLFSALMGKKSDKISIKNQKLKLFSDADLLVYIGHNGLMDFNINIEFNKKIFKQKEVIILCCKSKQFFKSYLDKCNSKSVLLTTGFMAPEAYTLKASLAGWMLKESGREIKTRAAKAYHKYQKCGLNGALRLFYND